MSILLGIDTGGTFTDAVLHDPAAPAPGIISNAKALTTHDDLAQGIRAAIDTVCTDTDTTQIGLVSISTQARWPVQGWIRR